MSVHERVTKRGTVYDVVWREGGRQRSKVCRTKAEAVRLDDAKRLVKQHGAYAPVEPSTITLDDWAEEWLRQYSGEWARTTLNQRAHTLDKWISPELGTIPLRELGTDRIREWRSQVSASGASARYVNNVVRVLSACLGAAVQSGRIPWNPCGPLKPLKEAPSERREWPDDTIQAIIAAMPTHRDRLVVALMAYAGLRPAEVAGLKPEDISGGKVRVRRSVQGGEAVTTKTSRPRNIDVRPQLAAVLDGYEPGATWLVPNADGGPLNVPMWSRRVWRPTVKRVGVDAVPYEMRHSFARLMLVDERLDVVSAAAAMGHSVRVLSDSYVHLL